MTRSVLVTGASKGIGQAIACQLAKDGFEVIIHYHSDRNGAEQTLAQIQSVGGTGRILSFDVSQRAQCRDVLEADIATFGAYYGVVNNAGITRDGAFPALSDDDWDSVIHTNLDSFYNVTGNRGQVNYSAAKAGIIGACKALSLELAKRKITVNCIAPGLIDTGMTDMEPAAIDAVMSSIPLKRMGSAEEVAGLASYLMSDIAGYVTRQVISINGGMV